MKDAYIYKIGDRVSLGAKPYIVKEMYFPKGFGFAGNTPAYTVYPPGKKNSRGYHIWVLQSDLHIRH